MEWKLSRIRLLFIRVLGIGLAIFHLYTAGIYPLPGTQQLAVHVALVLLIVYLTCGWRGKRAPGDGLHFWDLFMAILVIFPAVIAYISWTRWMMFPSRMTTTDLVSFAIAFFFVIEANRRLIGQVLNIVFLAILLYVVLGQYLPGRFGHAGFDWLIILRSLGMGGIWGWITSISARELAIFMLFGGLLTTLGGARCFMDIANLVAGRYRGGPAFMAVISSSLFGTCSGSAMANVITTGSVTIPLMKSLGYKPHFAGGVEASASTGGQIMPPVMGAGAFLMAEMLGIRYWDVCLAAFFPAFIYFASVFAGVWFEARRLNLQAVPAEKIPSWRTLITWQSLGPFVIPIAVLIFFLTFRSIGFAGFMACMAIIGVHLFSDVSPSGIWRRIRGLPSSLEVGVESVVTLAPVIFVAGLIVNLINLSGLGVKFTDTLISIGGAIPLLAAALTAVVAIILGMGMPTTPAYVIAAAVGAPAMIHLGLVPIGVHLFIFYYAILSGITPPVCTVAYTAGAVAGAPWIKVAWVALRLCSVSFFMPFLFLYYPSLMLMGSPDQIGINVLRLLVALIFFPAGIWGWFGVELKLFERALMIGGAVLIALPWTWADVSGLGAVAIPLITIFVRRRSLNYRVA